MPFSRTTKPNNSPNDAQPPSMPEHRCATLEEALEIVNTGRMIPLDAFEDKYGFVFRSDCSTASRYIREISDAVSKMSDECSSLGYLRSEDATTVVFAGRRFKFDSTATALVFQITVRLDTKSKWSSLNVRLREWQDAAVP